MYDDKECFNQAFGRRCRLARALHVTTDYLLYGRTDADGTWAAVAEHLTALTPATRDLAGELLKTMLDMLEAARPD